jgi:4-amino-4-deoxy-L-arabinose transferase-like glycosyltransferase
MLLAASYKRIWVYLGIIAFTALLLMPYLGFVHLLDSDETKYAESAREMLVTGDFLTVQIDYEPFPEKPPLFFWMQALSMNLFGINEFAARFPNIICGFASLIFLYYLGRQLYGHRFGLLWILSYGAAILPFFFFKSGIIDPWFNLFILMGVAWFIFYLDPVRGKHRVRNVVLSALFFGLAVLTKGPVALLIFLLCLLAFLSIHRFRLPIRVNHVILFSLVVILTGGSWFLILALNGNSEMVKDFLAFQIRLLFVGSSFHDGFFGYHLVVLLLGVFPASVIAMKSFTKKTEDTQLQKLFRQWMYIMFWVVIIFFTIVRTKLIHYSSLAYFPMTFLAAWVWEKWLDRKIEIGNWQVILIFLIATILGTTAMIFPLITDHYDWLMEKDFAFLDPFIRGALQRDVHWSGYEWMIGAFLLIGVMVACLQILRRNRRGMLVLHLVVLLFTVLSIYTFTPRVEGYAQRAAVKFFKELRGQDVYVNSLGFKSYSHLFYFDKQPTEEEDDIESLMNRVLEKDAYFVIRIDKKEWYLARYPDLEVLHEKDGYVFTIKRAGRGSTQ